MKNKKLSITITAIFLLNVFVIFGGASCANTNQPVDAGIWRSTDSGNTWEKKGQIFASSASLNNQNVRQIFLAPIMTEGEIKKFDALLQLMPEPSEEEMATLKNPVKTFYLSTFTAGLWTSNNDMAGWKKLNSDSNIGAIAPDPKNRNTLYFSEGPSILKSLNQGRQWIKIHQAVGDIKGLIVDHYNPNIVYAGTTQGFIYQSQDAGVSWKVVFQHPGKLPVKTMFMDSFDSRVIYVFFKIANSTADFQVTRDSGKTWMPVTGIDSKGNIFDALGNALKIKAQLTPEQQKLKIQMSKAQTVAFSFDAKEKMIVVACHDSFLQSKDAGKTWKETKLITPFFPIQFMLINSNDHKKIYYIFGTNNLLYKTDDAGNTWYNTKLPVGAYKYVTDFAMDPLDSNILYITLLENKPKKGLIPEVKF